MATTNLSVIEHPIKTSALDQESMETFVLVWLDADADKMPDIVILCRIVDYWRVFDDLDACVDFITDCRQGNICLMISSSVGEQIVSLIDKIVETDSIYIYCPNESQCVVLSAQFYGKVRGVFMSIDLIYEQLHKAIRRRSNNRISMSSISSSSDLTNGVNREQVSFMYSQLIRDLFLTLRHPIDQPVHALRDTISYFTAERQRSGREARWIEEVEADYESMLENCLYDTPEYKSIRWYTKHSCIFETLNHALRKEDIDMLMTMRFFIADIHKQLRQLYSCTAPTTPVTLYRGQSMSSEEFETLIRSKIGDLLTINNFWSTSTKKDVANFYKDCSKNESCTEAIVFQIDIDPQVGERYPFANVENFSQHPSEHEVLISMGSVYRICSAEKDNNRVWNVLLKLIDEKDEQLEAMADATWEKIRSDNGLLSLAKLMRLMGNFEKAEKFINELMGSTIFCWCSTDLALVINEIGRVYEEKGDFTTANLYYQKFVEMKEKRKFIWSNKKWLPEHVTTETILKYLQDMKSDRQEELNTYRKSIENEQMKDEPDRKKLAAYYRQMAQIYTEQEKDREALRMYEESSKIDSSIDLLPMETCSVIALLYAKEGNTQASEKYIAQTLKERPNVQIHETNIVKSYERIGLIYEIHEKHVDALNVYKQILAYPCDKYPNWDIVLANIGHVYEKQSKHSASLRTYERLRDIQLDILYSDHPLMADTYASIARSLEAQHKYEESYESLEKALKIDLMTMTPNHPWVGKRQTEMDLIQQKMRVKSMS